MRGMETISVKTCPLCGKQFGVPFADLWVYKRGSKYLCSYHCMRDFDKRGVNPLTKVTLEDKKKAVQIALDGGDPREFLKTKCKAPDVMWHSIRQALKTADPELYARLPVKLPNMKRVPEIQTPEGEYSDEKIEEDHTAMEEMKNAADEFFGKCEEAGLKIDGAIKIEATDSEKVDVVPAAPRITEPVHYDGFAVRCVEREYGTYYRDITRNGDYLDYENKDGDELSMTIEQWRGFLKELKQAAKVLGVDLDE